MLVLLWYLSHLPCFYFLFCSTLILSLPGIWKDIIIQFIYHSINEGYSCVPPHLVRHSLSQDRTPSDKGGSQSQPPIWTRLAPETKDKRLLSLFSLQVLSDSLPPHGLQHARLPCHSPSPRVCPSSHPLNQWCHPTISSSVALSPTNLTWRGEHITCLHPSTAHSTRREGAWARRADICPGCQPRMNKMGRRDHRTMQDLETIGQLTCEKLN